MNRCELARRLKTVSLKQFKAVAQMYREGYGTSGIKAESTATLKQINAIIYWVDRYGGILPGPGDLRPVIEA